MTTRTCAYCGAVLTPSKRVDARYCSPSHRVLAANRRHQEEHQAIHDHFRMIYGTMGVQDDEIAAIKEHLAKQDDEIAAIKEHHELRCAK